MEQNDLDGDQNDINLDLDPEDALDMFKITKWVTLVFIAQSLFDGPDRNPTNTRFGLVWFNPL